MSPAKKADKGIAKGKTDSAPKWRADPQAVEALLAGRHGDPFALLGPHMAPSGKVVVRAFLPGAERIEVIRVGHDTEALERTHAAGFFEGRTTLPDRYAAYRLKVAWPGNELELEDPYRFPPVLGELDLHLLAEGSHLRLYERLGAHPVTLAGVEGTAFAVWAPSARRVSVVGSFNGWDGRRHMLRKRHEGGVWEMFVPGVQAGELYAFEIIGADGNLLPLKADPVGFHAEMPPALRSRVHGLPTRVWQDSAWMAARDRVQARDAPMSIYEVHLGSWARVPEEGDRSLTYRELAERLVPYVADLGFTHIELLPITEHPFTGSWGYQPIGLFAPTARYGSPEDFAAFVDACHAADIGVLLDWVPGHFPSDPHGLGWFDGTALYEHADPRQGFHPDWNTLVYNFGRREVANFLHASALYWLERFHLDGLRVDAVASMLYLDYSRQSGEWIPNVHGGRENLEAIWFLRRMNELTYGQQPGIVTVAEESTAWPAVSRPTWMGGLGFGYKWNMGWMHDTLSYFSRDPIHRRFHQNDLTFSMVYAWSENYVLPLSHDEVVHGKGSLFGKMAGDYWQKLANLRALFAWMWTHPGKKLLFMGGEFAQVREWNHDASLDWHLLHDTFHRGVQSLVRDLNRLYRTMPALHAHDHDWQGFEWIDCNDTEQSVLSWLRFGRSRDEVVAVVANLTPVPRHSYRIGLPEGGVWREVLNTDAQTYGGSGMGNMGAVIAAAQPCHGRPCSVDMTLPPLAIVVLAPERATPQH